jgi:hypothetical protein
MVRQVYISSPPLTTFDRVCWVHAVGFGSDPAQRILALPITPMRAELSHDASP